MKKITKPAEREEAVHYSDFTGKLLNSCGPDIELKISCGYGSKRDGSDLTLHLNDDDITPIIDLIKQKLSSDVKELLKSKLDTLESGYDDSMQMRDWENCERLTNSIWFVRELLDLSDED